MSSALLFIVQALVIVALPVLVLRLSGLRGLVPLVVVQIVVGVALGPTLFGRLAPDLYQLFFNPTALAPLSGIAYVALLVFGLITGMHLDPAIFRDNGRATAAVAAANILVPMGLGALGAFWILARHPGELAPGVTSLVFAIAIGICVAMAALPVLAAILHEMDLLGRRLGNLALAVAGINDTVLWMLLGLLLAATSGRAVGGLGALAGLVLFPLYLFVMVRFIRPLLGKLLIARLHNGEVHERALVLVGAVTIASALATELMGLHYIIGAFVTGALVPDSLRKPILDRIQVATVALLMPFFFTLTGTRTLIDFGSGAFLDVFVMATVVAVVGIVGGTAIAARIAGESWSFALALGALLQTKGLMELVVLTILRDAGIISANVFAALTLMAIVTTMLAMPLARLMLRGPRHTRPVDTGASS